MAAFVRRRYGGTALRRFNFKKLVRDVKAVKAVVNSELKRFDLASSFTMNVAGTGWQLIPVAQIGQGDTEIDRNGAQVRVKSLQMNCKLRRGASVPASITTDRVRMIVFIDHQPLVSGSFGTDPLPSAMLTGDDVDALRLWDSIKIRRFTVLMDRTYKLDQDDPERIIKLYKKLNLPIKWANSSVGDAVISNNLYVAFFSDNGSLTSAERPFLEYVSRVTFRDN